MSTQNRAPSEVAISASPVRKRILAAAHDLFYREGIRAAGIDRVIAASCVTKVTFYRQFPSKNDLIIAYLEHRHGLWMDWFQGALERHHRRGRGVDVLLVAVFREWFKSQDYRGCAFLNAVVELAGVLPEVAAIARHHKDDVVDVIAGLLPESAGRRTRALAIAVALDGAILRAQMERHPKSALDALKIMLAALVKV